MSSPEVTLYNTDFARAIARNKRNTLILIIVLLAVSAVLGYVLGWAVGILDDIWQLPYEQVSRLGAADVLRDLFSAPRPQALLGMAILVGSGLIWSLVTLYAGARILSAFVGARPANPDNPAERRFIGVVEEMALAAGLPTPTPMVVDTPALNAFASGYSPEESTITATSGILEACTRDELQGVVGHEMGHVADYDVRYTTVVASMAGVAVLIQHVLWDILRWSSFSSSRDSRDRGGARGGLTIVVLILVAIVAIAAPLAAKLVQFAISRQREYMADATSVKFTRNPTGLIHALERLEQSDTALARADSPVSALCIAAPKSLSFSELFSTHPPLEERIERLRNLGGVTVAVPKELQPPPMQPPPHHGPWG